MATNFFELLALQAAALNRIVELLKPAIHSIVPESARSYATLATSLFIGVVMALFTGSLNIFSLSPRYTDVQETVALVITGLVIGALANAVSSLPDFVDALKVFFNGGGVVVVDTNPDTVIEEVNVIEPQPAPNPLAAEISTRKKNF